ncbi:MAG: ThuA domain-containing protein [Cyclobacteriaceae bacterium]
MVSSPQSKLISKSLRRLVQVLVFIASMSYYVQAQTILMFVSHEDAYYSEYIVMKEALEASGYSVDVRSANTQDFSIYMLPVGTDIAATANSLSGSTYAQFQSQFGGMFGTAWNETLNATPASLSVNGSILEVADITTYSGLVVVGGTGALDYRLDGVYDSQGAGDRLISSEVVEATAQKLNDLAIEALLAGKTVMAQCHGASLPVFWRVPNTEASGVETLGISLLKDGEATGYPETQTPVTLADFGVTHRATDRVTVSTPNNQLVDNGAGDYKIITTRDWYPQTVAHAARTYINTLETYPSSQQQEQQVSVLVIHGGAVDESNCSVGNRANDVPCNHGSGTDLPADYTDLMTLLETSDVDDSFNFLTTQIDITSVSLPFDKTQVSTSLSYLEGFDVVIFYKHWSTGITDELLQSISDFVDNGGGVIGLHHALYNDLDGAQNKDILISLFGAQSSQSGWSANLTNYALHSTNYGHFISTYQTSYDQAETAPASWSSNSLINEANASHSYLPTISIYDELYNNMAFEAGVTFGRGINEITPLFSNDQNPSGQVHTSAFIKLVDIDLNGQVGRAFFMQVGERQENYASNSEMYRVVRNAAIWVANKKVDQSIDFSPIANKTQGDTDFALPKFASSGLAIIYSSSDTDIAIINGNIVSVLGHGTTTITASQGGNNEYNAASQVVQNLTVEALHIWNGSSWNNATVPTETDNVLIESDYSFSAHGMFASQQLTVMNTTVVTVDAESTLIVNGDLINDGALIVESGSSLITFEANGFSGNAIEIRRNTRYADGSYSLVGSPVEQNANVTASTLGSSIYHYDETQPYSDNNGLDRWISATGELTAGKGYTQAFQQEIVFAGTPNTGTITYTGTYTEDVSDDYEGWNLVSNPYTASIEVSDFLAANNTTGAIYIWDDNGSETGRGTNSDYIVANGSVATNTTPAGGQTRYNGYMGVAQGFFVKLSDNSNTSIVFNEGMRAGNNNADEHFFRKGVETLSYIRINLTADDGLFKQTILAWMSDISDTKVDRKFDADAFSRTADYSIYTLKSDHPLAIQGVTYDKEEIPLGFNAKEAGTYEIEIDQSNFDGASLYLTDNQTGETIDLAQGSYSFNTMAGQITDRFVLSLASSVLSTDNQLAQIYTSNKILHINAIGSQPAQYELFNLSGKQLMTSIISSKTSFDLSDLPNGIYLVSDGVETKKIILR